jgi:hypothetical protein
MTSSTIDLGNGKTFERHRLPKDMLRKFDDAAVAFRQTQATVRSWVGSLVPMQAPADFSGSVICTGPGRSGRTHMLSEPGGAMLVESCDVQAFIGLGFAGVPSQQPSAPRVGGVFFDEAANQYFRWNGSAWAPVTLQ